MWYLLKASAMRAIWVSMVGLGLGTIAGALGLTAPNTVEALAAFVVNFYWGLAGLLWTAMVIVSLNDLRGPERILYSTLPRVLLFVLIESILSVCFSSALFYTMASNIPVFVRGIDPAMLREAIILRIGLGQVLLLLAVTTVGALAVGGWAHRRAVAH